MNLEMNVTVGEYTQFLTFIDIDLEMCQCYLMVNSGPTTIEKGKWYNKITIFSLATALKFLQCFGVDDLTIDYEFSHKHHLAHCSHQLLMPFKFTNRSVGSRNFLGRV